MIHTTKEKSIAIVLLETAKRAGLTQEGELKAPNLAAQYAVAGSDLTVLSVLEYPDLTKATL